jgi:ABC-2 type transport system ATP-binding protein
MWQITRDLVAAGVTIFLTTQNLEEADQLADYIAVLDRGRVVADGTPNELKRRIPGGHIQLHFRNVQGLDTAVTRLGEASRDDDALTLQVRNDGTPSSLKGLLDRLDQQSVAVERLTVHAPDLDDVFFALTGPQHKKEVTS